MATFKAPGLEKYVMQLSELETNTDKDIGAAVYEMARVVATEVKIRIHSLPSVSDAEGLAAYQKKGKAPITKAEKWGLFRSFGIAPMRNDCGFLNVKLGFDGYNEIVSKKYPMGQPNAMIARSIESGSGFRDKHPFIAPAVRAARDKAINAGAVKLDEKIHSIVDKYE